MSRASLCSVLARLRLQEGICATRCHPDPRGAGGGPQGDNRSEGSLLAPGELPRTAGGFGGLKADLICKSPGCGVLRVCPRGAPSPKLGVLRARPRGALGLTWGCPAPLAAPQPGALLEQLRAHTSDLAVVPFSKRPPIPPLDPRTSTSKKGHNGGAFLQGEISSSSSEQQGTRMLHAGQGAATGRWQLSGPPPIHG